MIIKLFKKIAGTWCYTRKELIKNGAVIGKNFDNYGHVDYNHCHLLTIGDDVTLASGARILLHDASLKKRIGYSKIGRVEIGSNVFIGANAIILPNIKIGSNVVIGAGTIVSKDIPDNCVVVGNPAKVISTYDDYFQKNKKALSSSNVFNSLKKTKSEKTNERNKMKNGGIGFDL